MGGMALYGGYTGKIGKIDLEVKSVGEVKLSDRIREMFIGGSGLGTYLLWESRAFEVDPLESAAPLLFMTGPVTGTSVFSSNRFHVMGRSPLTGILGEADCGGHWGGRLKESGFDGLVVVGKSDKPVYLLIREGEIEIKDASGLWGLDAFDTYDELVRTYGKSSEVVCIGPAGERCVLIASIMAAGRHGRAAGRCGLGAVMGSKGLKAIVAVGGKKVIPKDPEGLKTYMFSHARAMVEKSDALGEYGTSVGLLYCEEVGDLPIRNWFGRKWNGAQRINGQTMAGTILTGRYFCGQCMIGCGRTVSIKSGPFATQGEIGGPEYETLGMLGSNLLIGDLAAIAKENELCNRYGLDTISTGSAIAFAIEAYERGLLTSGDTDGLEIRFGDPLCALTLIEKIAKKEGIGDILGQGVRRAAGRIGGLAMEFASHVKGLELPAHDPRSKSSLALGYATSNRGACHLQAFTHDFEDGASLPDMGYESTLDRKKMDGKAEFTIRFQHLMAMFDSLKCCKFTLFGGITLIPLVRALNLVTGMNLDEGEFLKIGERIFNLKRMFNVACGISRKDDTLPPRILTHCRKTDRDIDELPPLHRMLNEYYLLRGWNEFGIPTRQCLDSLDLGWLVDDVSFSRGDLCEQS